MYAVAPVSRVRFGIGLVITAVIAAFVCWRKRGEVGQLAGILTQQP